MTRVDGYITTKRRREEQRRREWVIEDAGPTDALSSPSSAARVRPRSAGQRDEPGCTATPGGDGSPESASRPDVRTRTAPASSPRSSGSRSVTVADEEVADRGAARALERGEGSRWRAARTGLEPRIASRRLPAPARDSRRRARSTVRDAPALSFGRGRAPARRRTRTLALSRVASHAGEQSIHATGVARASSVDQLVERSTTAPRERHVVSSLPPEARDGAARARRLDSADQARHWRRSHQRSAAGTSEGDRRRVVALRDATRGDTMRGCEETPWSLSCAFLRVTLMR